MSLQDPDRLAAVRGAEFDAAALERIARLAASVAGAPASLVTLVDDRVQRTVASTSADFPVGGERDHRDSLCRHVVAAGQPYAVEDGAGLDGVGAYLGVPLRSPDGHVLGALCVVDPRPRPWSAAQRAAMDDLGAVVADELALRAATREIDRLVHEDPLTSLANRRYWEERAAVELSRAGREDTPLSIVLLNLDGFKAVNDELGRHAGDAVLREVGVRWRDSIRLPDVLARWGGDDFACLLVNTPLDGAQLVASRLAATTPEIVGVSHGTAQWRPGEPLDALVARADEQLYAAKQARG